jgi:hypothetical protein
VPTGIATDDSTKAYFGSLVQDGELSSFYSFENVRGLFAGVHKSYTFALITLARRPTGRDADLVFYAHAAAELADADRHFTLSTEQLGAINPNTRTCPTFRSKRDAAINLALYQRAGVLWSEYGRGGNAWDLRFTAMFHMANDSGRFRPRRDLVAEGWTLVGNRFERAGEQMVPLVEAKMVHLYHHRYADYADRPDGSESTSLPAVPLAHLRDPMYAPLPRYWVSSAEVDAKLSGNWSRGWLLGWRDICRSTDERTLIASVIPRSAAGDTLLLAMSDRDPRHVACLYANLCSFALDYAARQKIGGTHLKYHVFKQLPVLAPAVYDEALEWAPCLARDWILPRVLELTYTSVDLAPFARDVGWDGAEFGWDPERRFWLRCELDAAFLHLYGLSRDDAAHVLDTFPIVRKNDERIHGEHRTRRVILEVYDAMAGAARTGVPFSTRLDPPPADAGNV